MQGCQPRRRLDTLSSTASLFRQPLSEVHPVRLPVATSIPRPSTDRQVGESRNGDLVAGLHQGDEGALGAIFDLHGPTLFTLALAIVREEADAEEVVAEVFARLWRDPGAYEPERGTLGAFLSVMTRTRALDLLRSKRRRSGAEERAASAEGGLAAPLSEPARPDRQAERSELRTQIERALSVLSEPQRDVIRLAYFHGYTQSEIAARLSEPLGTVKTRMRSAMAKLRSALEGRREGAS